MLKVKPFESAGVEWDDKGRSEISQIFISHGNTGGIKSIQYFYFDNGNWQCSPQLTVDSAPQFHTVQLDYPSEYITSIIGTRSYSRVAGVNAIMSLTFGTNKRTYGPFGLEADGGTPFSLNFGPARQFGGFHGCYYKGFLTSIGVYVNPFLPCPIVKFEVANRKK